MISERNKINAKSLNAITKPHQQCYMQGLVWTLWVLGGIKMFRERARERKRKREREEKQQNSIFLLYSQPRAPVSPNSHSKQYQALSVSVLFIEFSAWVLLRICVHAECLLPLPRYEWWSTSPCLAPQRWQGWWCEVKKVKGVSVNGRADGGCVWGRKEVVVSKWHKLGKNSTTAWRSRGEWVRGGGRRVERDRRGWAGEGGRKGVHHCRS